MKTGKVKFWFALSVFFLCLVILTSLCLGSVDISVSKIISILLGENSGTDGIIVRHLRLPRIVASIIAGVSLALAGCGLQSIFRNPLAEPSITGVSSGASLGAVVAIMFFSSTFALEVLAFVFALLASLTVCKIGSEGGKVNPSSTILAGVAINALCGACVGLFMYTTRDTGLKSFVFWALGSFDKCNWQSINICLLISLPAWLIMLSQYKNLNAMLLGERQAFNIGVNVKRTQILVVLSAVAMTASCVAMCGTIGFVGLIIPHIARLICGAGNGKVMPLSMIMGASLMVSADLFARYLSPENPIPIGVLTAVLGAPFFVFILRRNKGNA